METNGFYRHTPVLTFHKVDTAFELGVTRVTPNQFKRIISFLADSGYETVSLKRLVDEGQRLPPKPIVITFDDGYASVAEVAAPVLTQFGFTATVFIITDYVGRRNEWDVNLGGFSFRHLGWNQVRELQRAGFDIQSHTHTHPDLSRSSGERMDYELRTSKKILEDKLGTSVDFVSYPFGRYTDKVIKKSRDIGYIRGIGCCCGSNGDNSYVLRRNSFYLFDTIWNLKAKCGENNWQLFEELKLKLINFCSHGTAIVKSGERKKSRDIPE